MDGNAYVGHYRWPTIFLTFVFNHFQRWVISQSN
jgi:hypothetical protein